MYALTTAIVPANVIRQVFTEALERLNEQKDELDSIAADVLSQLEAKHDADWACYWSARAKRKQGQWVMPPSSIRWGRLDHASRHIEDRAYYTLMLYTIETNAVVHMTQEQIQRMQQVDAENKAARKGGVRDRE